MGANFQYDEDPEDAVEDGEARWKAYLALMRKTGAIHVLPGLEDQNDDEEAPPAPLETHHAMDARLGEAAPAASSSPAILFSDAPGPKEVPLPAPRPRGWPRLIVATTAFISAMLILAPVARQDDAAEVGRRTYPHQGLLEPVRALMPPRLALAAVRYTRPGGAAAARVHRRVAAARPAAPVRKAAAKSAVHPAVRMSHDFRQVRLRIHAPSRRREGRHDGDDAPHAPLPPIWPDGKTLDIPR